MQYVLVTGSSGFVGKHIVRALLSADYYVLGISNEENNEITDERYIHRITELTDCLQIEKIFSEYEISHIIHLAAIAHTYKNMDDTWSRYYRINTLCSKTLFKCAGAENLPVFFASTIDVYGITKGEADANTKPNPIGNYARSKYLAEEALKQTCSKYTIARFAPIYSDKNRTDIKKRYYLRYPNLCYVIGKGKAYEFLAVDKVASLVVDWCSGPSDYKSIINVYDEKSVETKKLIESEKQLGRAKRIIHIPEMSVLIRILMRKPSLVIFKISKVFMPLQLKREEYKKSYENKRA